MRIILHATVNEWRIDCKGLFMHLSIEIVKQHASINDNRSSVKRSKV